MINNIQIIIDGKTADINNTEIRLEEEYLLLKTDLNLPDYTFPISFPKTDTNNLIFDFLSASSIGKKLNLPCSIIFNDYTLVANGEVIILGWDNKTYRATIRHGALKIIGLDKNLKNDLSWPVINMENESGAYGKLNNYIINNNILAANWQNKICFPLVKNGIFYNQLNGNYCGYINRWYLYYGILVENHDADNTRYAAVPMPYVFYVLKNIFDHLGYTIDGEWWNDAKMQKLAMYNNVSLDNNGTAFQCRVTASADNFVTNTAKHIILSEIGNDDFIEDGVVSSGAWLDLVASEVTLTLHVEFNRPLAIWDDATSKVVLLKNGTVQATLTLVPSAGEISGFDFNNTLTGIDSSDVYKYVIYLNAKYETNISNFRINKTNSFFTANPERTELFNNWKKNINIGQHIWDITCQEFINYWISIFGLDVSLNTSKKIISFDYSYKTLKAKPDIDITNLCDKDPIVTVDKKGYNVNYLFPESDNVKITEEKDIIGYYSHYSEYPAIKKDGVIIMNISVNRLFIRKYDPSDSSWGWYYYGNGYYPTKIFGDGSQEIKLGISPAMMREGGITEYDTSSSTIVNCLEINETGTSELFEVGENDYQKRFFFYSPGYDDQSRGSYGYGHTTGIKTDGNAVYNGNFNLSTIKTYGYFDTYLKPIYDYLSSFIETEFVIKMTSATITKIRNAKSVFYKGRIYILKNISIRMAKNIVESKLNGWLKE